MIVPDNISFVWMVNGSSAWNNEEIRYSIRSAKKYHPNNPVTVLGTKPSYYTGHFIEHIEITKIGYYNKWEKILLACEQPDSIISNPFVQMDDDIYLLQALQLAHYSVKGNYFLPEIVKTHWHQAKIDTHSVIKELPCSNFCIHAPLLIEKQSFLKMSNDYDWKSKMLIARQLYCLYAQQNNIFPILEQPDDCKLEWARPFGTNELFFSTYDKLDEGGFDQILQYRYNIPSEFEH